MAGREDCRAMDFEEFTDRLTDELGVRLHDHGVNNFTIGLKAEEEGGRSQQYVTMHLTGEENIVSANLTQAYERFQDGADVMGLASQMAGDLASALRDLERTGDSFIEDYDAVKPRLFVDLVSAKFRWEELHEVPHRNFLDMRMVYRAMVDPKDTGKGSVLITDRLLRQYDITEKQLHEDAMENAVRIRPPQVAGISQILGPGAARQEDEPFFVASVRDMFHGAGVIAYPGFLDQASKELGEDLFVLPSSVHEVLLVRDDGKVNGDLLSLIVQEVNAQEVRPEERLSDNAFHYDSRTHILEMADPYACGGRTYLEPAEGGAASKLHGDGEGRGSILQNLSEKAGEQREERAKAPTQKREAKGKGDEAI